MDVRAVSNYQEFVKVREMRILLYCILIENMKYLLCLSSPPQRKQDFCWTYPKVLAISVHDASTSRATSEVIRIRVEILWWAKIKRNLNTETVKKSMYNHLGENGKTLEKKKKPCTYLDTGYSSCSRLSGKFSLVACLSVPENINVKRQGQVWDEYWLPFNCKNIQFVRTSARAMSLWRHSGEIGTSRASFVKSSEHLRALQLSNRASLLLLRKLFSLQDKNIHPLPSGQLVQ